MDKPEVTRDENGFFLVDGLYTGIKYPENWREKADPVLLHRVLIDIAIEEDYNPEFSLRSPRRDMTEEQLWATGDLVKENKIFTEYMKRKPQVACARFNNE